MNELVAGRQGGRQAPASRLHPARAREPRRHPEREGLARRRGAGLDQPRARAHRQALSSSRAISPRRSRARARRSSRTWAARSEHEGELRDGIERALEIYAPLHSADGERVIGAYEVYADAEPARVHHRQPRARDLARDRRRLPRRSALALGLLVRRASNRFAPRPSCCASARRRSRSRSRRSSATRSRRSRASTPRSRPRTPTRPGHSARVQRVSLAIGRELRLLPDKLEILRWGGLFHDIGKIADPRRDPAQARPADPGGVRADEGPLRRGRPHRGQARAPQADRAGDPPPPRALGRQRAIPTAWPASTSRCSPPSSASPTPGTR